MKRAKDGCSTLRWIYGVTASEKGTLVLLFFVMILQGVEGIVFAFGLRNLVDDATEKKTDEFTITLILLCVLVLFAIVLYYCALYFKDKISFRLSKNLRVKVFNELLHRSYAKVSQIHTGEWMTRIQSDTAVVTGAVCTILPSLAGMLVQITCALISLFMILPKAVWVIIPVGIALIGLSLFLRVKLKAYHVAVQKSEGILYSFFQEYLSSMSMIRTFTKEEQSRIQAEEKLENVVDIRMKRTRFTAACATGIYMLVRIGYLGGVILCGIKLLDNGMTYGMMTAVLYLFRQVEAPLAEVTRVVPQFFYMLASAERLIEIEKMESDYSGNVLSPEEAGRFYNEKFSAIGLRDAYFSYDDVNDSEIKGIYILNGLNMKIEKGDYVAFTGASGCGKTTALKILMGLYSLTGGERYLCDKSGKEYPLTAEWRSLFAYVPQRNLLLSGKLRNAVIFTIEEENCRESEVWEALRIACAEDFVRELSDGLDTLLGEQGAGLSEGQMQRIAIARAIFSKRPILMLDEATSALDERTEKRLLENIKAMTDRTVIFISHRPAAVEICNKVVCFGDKV